jgi:hypothetical protein
MGDGGGRVRERLEILIFDVCFASDDKLQVEDRILNWRMKVRVLQFHLV